MAKIANNATSIIMSVDLMEYTYLYSLLWCYGVMTLYLRQISFADEYVRIVMNMFEYVCDKCT